jgi:hypothetical protein
MRMIEDLRLELASTDFYGFGRAVISQRRMPQVREHWFVWGAMTSQPNLEPIFCSNNL